MTERLYYTDPYLAEFDARVVALESHDGHAAAILDRTAFYPTSGGQPFDTGQLGDAQVTDVVDREDGVILHLIDRQLEPGPVRGTIDWPRRFEHMQQHTGQHILSAAFDRLLSARTESFHLGSIVSTIDLNRTVSAGDVSRAEDEANRVVWEDRPVAIRFTDAVEAAKLPLRKETAREGSIRLVDVTGFDISACGGTHVARTGAIGAIVVQSTERFRGGTRVEFLCGVRAVRGYRTLRDSVAASIRLVSVLPSELPAGIERLQADAKETKRQLKDLQGRLSIFEAARLVAGAEPHGGFTLVAAAVEGWDPNGLKSIASAVAAHPGHVAVIVGAASPAAAVIARAADVSLDSAAMLKQLVERFGGKGGGRPELAQGGGLLGAPPDIVAFARGLL